MYLKLFFIFKMINMIYDLIEIIVNIFCLTSLSYIFFSKYNYLFLFKLVNMFKEQNK